MCKQLAIEHYRDKSDYGTWWNMRKLFHSCRVRPGEAKGDRR